MTSPSTAVKLLAFVCLGLSLPSTSCLLEPSEEVADQEHLVLASQASPAEILPQGIDISITIDYTSGYCASLTVTNDTASRIASWEFTVEVDGWLINTWGGRYTQRESTSFTVENEPWNGVLDPGQSTTGGFCVTR